MTLITPLEPGSARTRTAPARDGQGGVHPVVFGRIVSAVASSCGSLHSVNEDAHSDLDRCGPLFVVADGVGGGAMAALASRELVAHLHSSLEDAGVDALNVRRAVLAADRLIADRIAELTDTPGAATLAMCAPANGLASRWLLAWVGDCRIYRRDAGGSVRVLTQDDTFEHLKETPPAGGSPQDPARMVGNGAVASANVEYTELASGDMLLVCSDGVHKFVPCAEFDRLLARPLALSQQCCDIIELARSNGSTDDATVLLLRRERLAVQGPQWLRRFADRGRTTG